MTAVVVRPMRRRHLTAVMAIDAVAYARPWPRGVFEADLRRDDRCYVVAQRGRLVVGYAGASVGAGEAHVLTLAVAPDRRGQGVGRRLLDALIAAVHRRGAAAVTLEVRASNAVALRLYERAGFVVEGRRPRYYVDDGEDALIMWRRDLQPGPPVPAGGSDRARPVD